MTNEFPIDILAPKPMSMEDVQRLVGSLYLEIDLLRRQIMLLRTHIESNTRVKKEQSV